MVAQSFLGEKNSATRHRRHLESLEPQEDHGAVWRGVVGPAFEFEGARCEATRPDASAWIRSSAAIWEQEGLIIPLCATRLR